MMNETVQTPPESVVKAPVQVWLVDDNNRLRELIAESLERSGSIRCARQFDSPNGLLSTLASRNGPDVILLDVQMGELNGLDALPAIKSLAPQTHVFMLTTFFDAHWHERAMNSGASGYHLKGDSMELLVASIRGWDTKQLPVRRRRRSTCQSPRANTPQVQAVVNGMTSRLAKKPGFLSWFKRFSSN